MQRTSVLGKKVLKNGASMFKKGLFQSYPFLTRRLMATGTLKKPGANSQTRKVVKGNRAMSVAMNKLVVPNEVKDYIPWFITQQLSSELKITKVFESITREGKLIEEQDKTENLKKIVNALNDGFEKTFGMTPDGLMNKFTFYSMIKDPSKLAELMVNIISVKKSFSGYYHLMNLDLRGKSKGIKTENNEQSDHAIAVSDVGLKLIIQTLKDKLPSLDEFEEIYKALNDKSNRRAIPSDVHKIISRLEYHELNAEGTKMVSIQEKLKNLSDEDRKKLNTYLRKSKKNFGTVQEEYCETFTLKLSESKSEFVKNFADNFNDFYINHVLYNVQKGGGFDSKEEAILVFLLHLLYNQNANNETIRTFEPSAKNENDHEQVVRAYNTLVEIKKVKDAFFEVAKDIYQSSSKDTNEDIIKRYNTYLAFKFEKPVEKENERPSKKETKTPSPMIELRGGKTRKLY